MTSTIETVKKETPKLQYTLVLIARQGFYPDGQLRLNPRIDTLTAVSTTAAVEAYETFKHLEEVSGMINTEIAEDMEDETNEEPTDLPSFFDPENNPCMSGLPIHEEGYSELTPYIKISKGAQYTFCTPDDFNHLVKITSDFEDKFEVEDYNANV